MNDKEAEGLFKAYDPDHQWDYTAQEPKGKTSLEEFTELMASEGPAWANGPDWLDQTRRVLEQAHGIKLTWAPDGKHLFRPLRPDDN